VGVRVDSTRGLEMAVAAGTRIGFIGAGQMAEAIAKGLNSAGVVLCDQMIAADVNLGRCKVFQNLGIAICASNMEVAEASDVLILAVKPQIVEKVATELKPSLSKNHLLISIAAGVTLVNLQRWAGEARVVRVMPNLPCLVGATAAALSLGSSATQADSDLVIKLFEALGKIHVVDEKLLNAVTGLSGSGPGYVFLAIEALADGGVAAGLPRPIALSLAAQTVLGSAKMVLETNKHPGQLKDEVASPGGTTIAGIHELEKMGFRAALMNAVLAATERGEKFSK
jgi:pyrroline-5-carboxylate reductase